MNNDKDPRLVEKLLKIKAMTTSPNEEEAETAMLMLDKLLNQHGIDPDKLSEFEKRARYGDVQEEVLDGILSHNEGWAKTVRACIAAFYNCSTLFDENARRAYIFGREANIAAVKWLLEDIYSKLIDSIEGFYYKVDGTRYADAYALGLKLKVMGILEKRAVKAQAGEGEFTGLSLRNESKDAMYEMFPLARKMYTPLNPDREGRGLTDGMSARLSTDMGTGQLRIGDGK